MIDRLNPTPLPPHDQTSRLRAAPRTYDVRGVVEDLKPEIPAAVIRLGEIPGFLEAMSATLRAKDAGESEGLQPGDSITFRLNVTSDDGWIDWVKVMEPGQAPSS